MSSLFSKPKPKIPTPAPPPKVEDAASNAAMAERQRRLRAGGKNSTMLTSQMMAPAPTIQKKLLGA